MVKKILFSLKLSMIFFLFSFIFLLGFITLFMLSDLPQKYAKEFVYTENINVNDKKTEIPIGVSCRTCDRLDCSQRAFPPLHKKFDVDINSRGVSVYVSD